MEGLRQEQRQNNIKSTIISPGAVATELYKTITDPQTVKAVHEQQLAEGLTATDIAQAVTFAIYTPARMGVSDMVIRPIHQDI